MDVEARLLLYTVALGAVAGLVQLLRRRAFAFRVYMAELAALLAVAVAGVVLPEWTRPLAWPCFGAFAAVAIVPPALLDVARRSARSRRYRLARWSAHAGALLLGLPAPLRREAALYAAMAAADRGDAAACRARLEDAERRGGIPAELGGRALTEALPAAAARRWADVLRVLDASPARTPTLLALEARAASEQGDPARAIRAARDLDLLPAPASVRAAARRAVLAASGRAEFLEDAVRRRLPVADGPPGAAALALARAHEAAGDAARAAAGYEAAARRGRGLVRIDALEGRARVAEGRLRPAGPADEASLRAIEALCATERRALREAGLARRAPFTVAITCAVVLAGAAGIVLAGFDSVSLLAAGALSASLVAEGDWWRLLAATFLHGGWAHLAMNASAILLVGVPLETRLGPMRTAIVYVTSGLAASAASAFLAGTEIGVGASGAAMGLVGALGAALLFRRALFEPAERGRWLGALGITVAATAAFGALEHEAIDNAAHGAGLVAGLLLGAAMLPRGRSARAAGLRRALGAALCGALAASGAIALLRSRDWRGERAVAVRGARAMVPSWLRVSHPADGLARAARPPLGFVVVVGAGAEAPSPEVLALPGETLGGDGGARDAAQGFRVRVYRSGAAFALLRVPLGPDDEAAFEALAVRIGASLEAVE